MKKILFSLVICLGLLLSSHSYAADYSGAWLGNTSGWSFQLQLWTVNGEWNALLKTDNVYENLVVLGYDTEEEALYLYRPSAKSCLTVFGDGKLVYMGYFKKDEAAKIMLMKI